MFRLPSVLSVSVVGLALFCSLVVGADSRAQDQPETKSTEAKPAAPEAKAAAPEAKAATPESKAAAPDTKATAPDAAVSETDFLKSAPYDGARTTLAGRWVLMYFNGQGESQPLFVLDISGSENGPLKAEPVSMVPDFAGSTIKSIAQQDGLLEFEITAPGAPLLFQGRRDGPVIRGNIAAPSGAMFPGRLYAARSGSFDAYKSRDEAHLKELADAWTAEGKARVDKLQEFVAKYPESPLAIDAGEEVLRQADLHNMDPADVEKAADTYFKLAGSWGPRLLQDARIAAALALCRSPRLAQLALKYVAAAEEHIADTIQDTGRMRLKMAKARALIATGNEENRNQGAETLRQMHEKFKYDTRITAELLDFERQYGQIDKAIELAAQLVAFPPTGDELQKWQSSAQQGVDYVGTLKEQLKALWTKKHGDDSGLEAYLDTVYLQVLDIVSDEKPEPKNTGGKNRVALYEMFTGAACAPCIAADLSLSKVERSLPQSDAIVLRYHQHIPGPDPFVSSDGQQRAEYYEGQSTPRAFANGEAIPHVGGFLDDAPAIYTKLREPINSIVQTPSDIDVKLTADVNEGVINFSATADGVKKIAAARRLDKTSVMMYLAAGGGLLVAIALVLMGPRTNRFVVSRFNSPFVHALLLRRIRWLLAAGFLVGAAAAANQLVASDADIGDLRLRLALAENDIHFAAPNGIRIHDGIVRVMPGGSAGIKPTKGRLAYSGSIDLYALRRQLGQDLADFERKQNIEFRARPLDLSKLTLVAFVQNETTKEILQSAAVSLKGLPASPKMPSPPSSPAGSPAENKQSELGPVLNDPSIGADAKAAGPSLTPPVDQPTPKDDASKAPADVPQKSSTDSPQTSPEPAKPSK